MKKVKLFGFSLIALGLSASLTACGSGKGKTAESNGGKGDVTHSAVVVTDTGNTDDKLPDQSSWEGLQVWGKEHNLPGDSKGYAYIQSNDVADYTTNINQTVLNKFSTIFDIGCLLRNITSPATDANPDASFVLIDDQIDGKKDAISAIFRDNEAAYLAGVAAANEVKANKVGFIGGEGGVVIDCLQAGFERGVADTTKELGEEITVDTKYATSSADSARGKTLAAAMCQNGIDIILHASGATGQGVFQEVKDLNESDSGDKIWVAGVDRDQDADSKYKIKDSKEDNFMLTSTPKGVGATIQDIANRALEDKFPSSGHSVYGLEDGGVDLTDDYLGDKTKEVVRTTKDKMILGNVKVPEKPE